jgi:hypothetical protein
MNAHSKYKLQTDRCIESSVLECENNVQITEIEKQDRASINITWTNGCYLNKKFRIWIDDKYCGLILLNEILEIEVNKGIHELSIGMNLFDKITTKIDVQKDTYVETYFDKNNNYSIEFV